MDDRRFGILLMLTALAIGISSVVIEMLIGSYGMGALAVVGLDTATALVMIQLGDQYCKTTIDHYEVSFHSYLLSWMLVAQGIRQAIEGNLLGVALFLVFMTLTIILARHYYFLYQMEIKDSKKKN